jgi:hypothetical protein
MKISRLKIVRFILLIFALLNPICFQAQVGSGDSKKGTIHVKRTPSQRALLVLERKRTLKRLTGYLFIYAGHHYKITFPPSYKSNLYPLAFNNRALAICDADKNLTSNRITFYEYELFSSAIFIEKRKGLYNSVIHDLSLLPPGSSAWIINLQFLDEQKKLHENEISTFKIEKLD